MKRNTPNLPNVTSRWPTPIARDAKREGGVRKSPPLSSLLHQPSGLPDNPQSPGPNGPSISGPRISRQLNVQFVEVLMGFPVGYSLPTASVRTAYEAWEIRSAALLGQWLGPSFVGAPSKSPQEALND